MAVYSQDRVRRLRILLLLVVTVAAVLALLAVWELVANGTEEGGVASLVAAALLLGSGGSAVILLREAEKPARVACLVTGGLCVLAAIGAAGSWLSLLFPVLGLGLLFLALIPDPEQAQ
jgi:hypothetical protein